MRPFSRLPNELRPRLEMFLPSVWSQVHSGDGGNVIEPGIEKLLDQLFKASQKQVVLDALDEEIHRRQVAAENRVHNAWVKARGNWKGIK